MDQIKMGKFISELRKEKGLTQKEIGEVLNITDNSVSKWERGINAPDIYYLQTLADLFNVSVQELLKGERNFKKKKIDEEHHNKVLEVNKICKSFGKRKVLNNISFDIREGDIVGLIGPNGSGKTTLIKTILSLYRMDFGSIKICGFDIREELEEALTRAGGIIENPDMYSNLSGKKNLQITALINNINDKDFIDDVIKFVNLEKRINDKVKTYSLGMKQRLGIANALIKNPKLLILDEPTNGLDPAGIKELRIILKTISRESNISILISSHILSEIENICDEILVIDQGKIVSKFGIEEVKYKNISLEDEYFKLIVNSKIK